MNKGFLSGAGLTGATALFTLLAIALPAPGTAQDKGRGGGDQIANAGSAAVQDRRSHSPAEALYVEKCAMCHRQMGMGTMVLARRTEAGKEMLELRENLTPDYVKLAARNGIGNMPRIQRGEVSDAQLDIIARYLAKEKTQ